MIQSIRNSLENESKNFNSHFTTLMFQATSWTEGGKSDFSSFLAGKDWHSSMSCLLQEPEFDSGGAESFSMLLRWPRDSGFGQHHLDQCEWQSQTSHMRFPDWANQLQSKGTGCLLGSISFLPWWHGWLQGATATMKRVRQLFLLLYIANHPILSCYLSLFLAAIVIQFLYHLLLCESKRFPRI